MAEANKVVVHFVDGRLIKGTTQDFLPNRPLFHVVPATPGPVTKVQTKDLKAVYFVKSLDGRPGRRDLPGFSGTIDEARQGKKIAVLFKDGELFCGTTLSFTPGRPGFFVFPADRGGNNLRVYVVSSAVAEVKAGPAAEALAKKVLRERRAA